jgi:hypothetical protein
MFKKAVTITQHKLRGSDVKRLKRDMVLAMPTLTDEDVDSVIPGKADVIMYKMSNRSLVYAVDGQNPLVFDPVRAPLRACAPADQRERRRRRVRCSATRSWAGPRTAALQQRWRQCANPAAGTVRRSLRVADAAAATTRRRPRTQAPSPPPAKSRAAVAAHASLGQPR